MMYESQSSFCYPGTDILINKENIRNFSELTKFESIVSTKRLNELILKPIRGYFDMEHLKKIHYHLFQDVYPFAGQIRTEDINKDGFPFAKYEHVESQGKSIINKLHQDKCLKETSIDVFSEKASYYMAEINVLHPFREGNGRTQREFIRNLASDAGYLLNWQTKSPLDVFLASVKSKFNTKDLTEVIRSSIKEKDIALDREWERER